jgi:hypothetical protein
MKKFAGGVVLALVSLSFAPIRYQGSLPPPVWTSVGSAGSVDESAAAFYQFNNAALEYRTGSMALNSITARYNVVDIADSGLTVWDSMELGFLDTSSQGSVTSTLIRIDPCTNTVTSIASVTSVDAPTGSCVSVTFPPIVDFSQFVYYVQVVLSRTSTAVNPRVNTIRLSG